MRADKVPLVLLHQCDLGANMFGEEGLVTHPQQPLSRFCRKQNTENLAFKVAESVCVFLSPREALTVHHCPQTWISCGNFLTLLIACSSDMGACFAASTWADGYRSCDISFFVVMRYRIRSQRTSVRRT